MDLFCVTHKHEEYSDSTWQLLGVFSSKKLAQDYIDEKCTQLDPTTKFEEWKEALKAQHDKSKAATLLHATLLLEKRKSELTEAFQLKVSFPWLNISARVDALHAAIAVQQDTVDKGGVPNLYGYDTLERYIATHYPVMDRYELHIEPFTLDKAT